jgi:hypothetical protein
MASTGIMMIMMMAVGMCVFSSITSGAVTAMVNEDIIDVDFLDFLLIPGWGKDKDDDNGDGTKTTTSSTNCIDQVIEACDSGQESSTLFDVDKHDTCVSEKKSTCLNDGGAWTSGFGTYPSNCVAGARIECVTLRKKDRDKCMQTYKKNCKAATESGSSTNTDQNQPFDNDCVVFYSDDSGTKEIHRHCLKGENVAGSAWTQDSVWKGVGSVRVGKDVVFEGFYGPYMNAAIKSGMTKPIDGKPTVMEGDTKKCLLKLPWNQNIRSLHERGCSWANDGYIKDSKECSEKIDADIVINKSLGCTHKNMGSYIINKKGHTINYDKRINEP